LWQSIADRIKSSDFNERMETARKDMGPKLTTALIRQLTRTRLSKRRRRTVTAVAAEGDHPTIDDQQAAPNRCGAATSTLDEVGMYSARFSKDYVPRVNREGLPGARADEDELYSETHLLRRRCERRIRRGACPQILDHHWSSFDELIDSPQEVAQSYDYAVDASSREDRSEHSCASSASCGAARRRLELSSS
jgi:hypothetical protein